MCSKYVNFVRYVYIYIILYYIILYYIILYIPKHMHMYHIRHPHLLIYDY